MENTTNFDSVGQLVDIDTKDNSLTFITGDNKLIRLGDVKLYGAINQFFTKFILKKLSI